MAEKKPELVEMGLRLKELRDIKGKSQKEAAAELGLNTASVLSSYEVGDREPPITILNNMAKYYGVTVDYLIGNSVYKNVKQEFLFKNTILSYEAISAIDKFNEQTLLYLNEFLTYKYTELFLLQLAFYRYSTEEIILKNLQLTKENYSGQLKDINEAYIISQINLLESGGKYELLKRDVEFALVALLEEIRNKNEDK